MKPGSLYLDGASVVFDGFRALNSLSLIIEPGELRAIIGPNGAGKTTMMDIITGKTRPAEGTVSFGDHDLTKLDEATIGNLGIGRKFQKPTMFDALTVFENLETALAAAPRGSKVPDDVFVLCPILKLDLLARGGDLAGGQQQQLAIARALTARPRLLILDEPTESIQPNVIKDIARVIALLARSRNMAVVLVEQYYEFARELGDQLAIMVRGEVALAGLSGSLDEEAVRRLLTV